MPYGVPTVSTRSNGIVLLQIALLNGNETSEDLTKFIMVNGFSVHISIGMPPLIDHFTCQRVSTLERTGLLVKNALIRFAKGRFSSLDDLLLPYPSNVPVGLFFFSVFHLGCLSFLPFWMCYTSLLHPLLRAPTKVHHRHFSKEATIYLLAPCNSVAPTATT